jgi:hypothetical protein
MPFATIPWWVGGRWWMVDVVMVMVMDVVSTMSQCSDVISQGAP